MVAVLEPAGAVVAAPATSVVAATVASAISGGVALALLGPGRRVRAAIPFLGLVSRAILLSRSEDCPVRGILASSPIM